MESIVIEGSSISSTELQGLLRHELMGSDIQLELSPRPESRNHLMDPTVLAAMVAGTSAAVSALVTGLMKILEKRTTRVGKVVIRFEDGTSIEIPAGTSSDELRSYIDQARTLRVEEMRLITPRR